MLGFTAAEEGVYRLLLGVPGASTQVVAALLGVELAALRDALARLVGAGLVELTGDVVMARPPADSLGPLIAAESERQQLAVEQLTSLRSLLPKLVGEHVASQTPHGERVEIETLALDDVVPLFRSMSAVAAGDLLWLRNERPHPIHGPVVDDWVIAMVRSGLTSRAIYPARMVADVPEVVRARADAGEEVRILASVPSRLAILGNSLALLPEVWGDDKGRWLAVRQVSMIRALRQLFDTMWDQADLLPGLNGVAPGEPRDSVRRLLLGQLAAGAKDEQIARRLGLSLRTVRRRVAAILDELGVDSRFQAGVEAVRQGWL